MKKLLFTLFTLFLSLELFAAGPGPAESAAAAEPMVKVEEGLLEKSTTPLIDAVLKNDADKVKEILEKPNAQVNATDVQGRTALFIAVQEKYNDILKLLLETEGIDKEKADKDGLTPLAIAAQEGNAEFVQALLGDCLKYREAIRSSLGNPAEEAKALELPMVKCPNVNVADKRGFTPLMRAAKAGHKTVVKMLLDAGASTQKKVKQGGVDVTAAELAANYQGVVKLIKGYRDRSVELIDRNLGTIGANVEKAKKLLAQGVDLNINDSKHEQSALQLAVIHGLNEIVKILIELGIDVNHKDEYGKTAINRAFEKKTIIEQLINAGASVTDINWESYEVLNMPDDVRAMLVKAGADKRIEKTREQRLREWRERVGD